MPTYLQEHQWSLSVARLLERLELLTKSNGEVVIAIGVDRSLVAKGEILRKVVRPRVSISTARIRICSMCKKKNPTHSAKASRNSGMERKHWRVAFM
jgi:hypothetical protein